jgi:glycosyltransferase involved in cell wall biosynthesis
VSRANAGVTSILLRFRRVPGPRVSVIVPVYNRPAFVRQAIDSALAQECRGGAEIVVVDDGSTDETPDVLASYGRRIRVVRQENGGVARARNAGFAAARGEFFALLDSDDIWLPGKLDAQVALLDASPDAGFAHSDVAEFFEDGSPQRKWTRRPAIVSGSALRVLLRRNVVHTMTVMLRRRAIEEVGDFDPRYPPCEDWDLWLRIAEHRPIVGDARAWVRTRVHSGGISANPLVVYTQACDLLAAAALRLAARKSPDVRFARRQAARWCVKLGRRLVRAGWPKEGEAAFRRAIGLHPLGRLDVFVAKMSPKR